MQFAHNGYYKGSIPFGLIIKIIIIFIIIKGTWSSLVYGARFENEYLIKVVSSNLTVSDNNIFKRRGKFYNLNI